MAKASNKPAANFEEIIVRIEQRAAALEQDEMPLGEALKTYEQAVADLAAARKIISQAEEKIKILTVTAGGESALADWQASPEAEN